MRTLRLSLAGTVILALLGGLSVAVVAQVESEVATGPDNALVTYLTNVCDITDTDLVWSDSGISIDRGREYACETTFSDPRVSGTRTGAYNSDCFGELETPCLEWGTDEIVGPDGSWTGSYQGILDGDRLTSYRVYRGTAGYEGLAFIWLRTGTYDIPGGYGLVYAGEPPPMPALAPTDPGVPPEYPDPIVATPETTTEAADAGAVASTEVSNAEDEPLEPMSASRAPSPSAGCGIASTTTGTSLDSMEVDDLVRSWYTHVPAANDGHTPLPLVIQLHGNGSDATFLAGFTGLDGLGDEKGFVTVTPEGRGLIQRWIYEFDERGWDDTPTNPDILFIGALIDRLGQQLCLDLARVYVTGISNGGQAASALACVLDERIAAIAPVAGLVDSGDDCRTARPVPMLAFHGQEDPIALFDGGLAPFVAEAPSEVGTPLGDLPMAWIFEGPVTERVAGIAERYGCAPDLTTALVAEHVERIGYACPDDADVALVVAMDGGHAWPGAAFPPELEAQLGHVNMEINASRMMWDFFAQHALPEE